MRIGKKISKILKVTLVLCMVFTDLASPIKVLADTLEPSYNLDVIKNESNKIVISSTGDKEVNIEDTYVIKVVRSFKYTDGGIVNTLTEYMNVLGSELNTGILLDNSINMYNGVSYIDVNVYEIVDKTILEDLYIYDTDDYEALLDSDKVLDIMNSSYEEVIDSNLSNITYNVIGDNVSCNIDKCVVNYVEESLDVVSNYIYIDYNINKGNFNPGKSYVNLIYINDKLYDIYSEGDTVTLDFMDLLGGVYNVKLVVRDITNNNDVLSTNIEFNYDRESIEDINSYFGGIGSKSPGYGFISYTVLTDEEINDLSNDYKFYDNRIAFEIDRILMDSDVVTSYNLYNNDIRYHVIASDYFKGVFEKNDNTYTVGNLISYLKDYIDNDITVTKDDVLVSDDSILENGMKVNFSIYGEVITYDILVYGDVDGGLVEESDISSLIDKIINDNLSYYDTLTNDLNEDEDINIVDVSLLGYSIFKGEFSLNTNELSDDIIANIEVEDKVIRVGDKFNVTLRLDGFDNDYINAIDSLVSYDSDSLRLDNVSVLDNNFVGSYILDRIMYASSDSYDTNNEEFITFTFTALKEGNFDVSLDNMLLVSDGVLFDKVNSNVVNVKVDRALRTNSLIESIRSNYGRFDKEFNSNTYNYNLYVDSYVNSVTLSGTLSDIYAKTDGFKEYQLTGDNTNIEITVYAEDGSSSVYSINVIKVYKSSNNNLSNIVIEGHDIEFDSDTLEYNIEVDSDVTELDISAIVEDYRSWAKIEGNENFKTGKNVVTVKVYAEDGSTKTYTINVTKKEKVVEPTKIDTDNVEESGNTERTIIVILIILVVVGLLYLIFKKDEEEEDVKITEIKPKKDKK